MESAFVPEPFEAHALLASADHDGPLASVNAEQLHVNLIRLSAGAQIAAHVNSEVDVFIVVVAGEGVLTLDGKQHRVRAGDAIVIPRRVRRAIASADGIFAYWTCHRRRAGLMPT
jgi:quercetin dioxygenase-like cupin family protein